MGKTVPTYRLALEFEIGGWQRFRKALTNKDDLVAFDELMDACRRHASAASNATRPVVFEAMAMSILLDQAKKIRALEEQVCVVLAKRAGLKVTEVT